MQLTDLDADALSRAIHAKEVSCREVMRATLDRIAAVNPRVNATRTSSAARWPT